MGLRRARAVEVGGARSAATRSRPASLAANQIRVTATRAAGLTPMGCNGVVSLSGVVCGPYM